MNPTNVTSPRHHVEQLPAISLAELNDAASLQTRVDRKYIVEQDQLDAMVSGLGHRLAALVIDDRRAARYESVYFDTPDLASYCAAARRRRLRFKVRTRTYLDSATTMLEVKTKGARKVTVKARQRHSFEERTSLGPDARCFVDEQIERPGLAATLLPTLTTTYRRTTLVDLDDVARLTIDANLVCRDFRGASTGIGGLYVVETKSAGTASAADRWLWEHGIRTTKISKYGTGMAALHPSLPSNKWHRTRAKYFL